MKYLDVERQRRCSVLWHSHHFLHDHIPPHQIGQVKSGELRYDRARLFCECVTASFKLVVTLTLRTRKEGLHGKGPLILEILFLTQQQVGPPLFRSVKVTVTQLCPCVLYATLHIYEEVMRIYLNHREFTFSQKAAKTLQEVLYAHVVKA